MSDDETLLIEPKNLVVVLSSFFKMFKGNPLKFVPMDEAVYLFGDEFGLNEEGEYQVTEKDMLEFMNKINRIQATRLMEDMAKRGLGRLGWDAVAGDIVLIANPGQNKV